MKRKREATQLGGQKAQRRIVRHLLSELGAKQFDRALHVEALDLHAHPARPRGGPQRRVASGHDRWKPGELFEELDHDLGRAGMVDVVDVDQGLPLREEGWDHRDGGPIAIEAGLLRDFQ